MQPKIVPVIMCGGSGTRLWPQSRTHEPKQLQVLFGDQSLLVHTAKRLSDTPGVEAPLIVCGAKYADVIEQQLVDSQTDFIGLIEEPMGRDTAAAAGVAAMWLKERYGDNAVMVLLPADHYVQRPEKFSDAVLEASRIAQADFISTIGISPTHPDTGFGYIRRAEKQIDGTNGFLVQEFVEKPDIEVAISYLEDGGYVWNSGIFAVKGSVYLKELNAFEPNIFSILAHAYETSEVLEATKDRAERFQLNKDTFGLIPKKSIDYAVMEQTASAAVVPAAFLWSDVGNWGSVKDLGNKDNSGNVVEGDVYLKRVENCYAKSKSRTVALVGVKDLYVVDTDDALLVCHQGALQDIKSVHQQLMDDNKVVALKHGAPNNLEFEDYQNWARHWLFDKALPFWADIGEDREKGGVFEALDNNGEPLTEMVKRFRVQARQVYVFSHAYELGWKQGAEALQAPLDFMLKHCWLEEGGWGHLYNRDGSVNDPTLDTYDQAFALVALGWAYKVTGEKLLLSKARDTLGVLESRLRHPLGGFAEGIPSRSARRANPHMHLFEAAIHWMQLHQDEQMAEMASEIFDLFKTRFCVNGLLREHFNDDLSLISDKNAPELTWVEPGHMYEWAYLLGEYEKLTGRSSDVTATMEAFADFYGVSEDSGFVLDFVQPNGRKVASAGSRLWPQTEYIRLKLASDQAPQRQNGLKMLEWLKQSFLTIDDEQPGFWRDKLNVRGDLVSETAPASTLYHLVGTLRALL